MAGMTNSNDDMAIALSDGQIAEVKATARAAGDAALVAACDDALAEDTEPHVRDAAMLLVQAARVFAKAGDFSLTNDDGGEGGE